VPVSNVLPAAGPGGSIFPVTTTGSGLPSTAEQPTAALPDAVRAGIDGGDTVLADQAGGAPIPGFDTYVPPDPRLVAFLEANHDGERYVLATANAMSAAPLIIEHAAPVAALGGFIGQDPIRSVGGVREMVEGGEVRFFLVPDPGRVGLLTTMLGVFGNLTGEGGPRLPGFDPPGQVPLPPSTGPDPAEFLRLFLSGNVRWVADACEPVPAERWQTPGRIAATRWWVSKRSMIAAVIGASVAPGTPTAALEVRPGTVRSAVPNDIRRLLVTNRTVVVSTEPIDVERARAETPGCAEVAHFNNAGASLMPRPVVDAVVGHLELESKVGGYEAAGLAADRIDRVYGAAADLLGCAPDEIAVVENATRAWDMAFYSLPFGPGDRILTARAEYASNVIAFLQLARRHGVSVEVVPDDETGQLSVTALRDLIDDRVKLIAVTHVPTNGGLVNPAAAIGAVAGEAGIPYLLDACQSVGQMPSMWPPSAATCSPPRAASSSAARAARASSTSGGPWPRPSSRRSSTSIRPAGPRPTATRSSPAPTGSRPGRATSPPRPAWGRDRLRPRLGTRGNP
jgi:hypothetical protein